MQSSDLRNRVGSIHDKAFSTSLIKNKKFTKRPFRYQSEKINYHALRDLNDLKDLHAYRTQFADDAFGILKNYYRDTTISDAGSSNITSDIDAMVDGPFKEEVKQDFNQSFEGFFKQDSSSLLDVNMYDVRMLAIQGDNKHCKAPLSLSEIRTKTGAPSYICRLDLRDDPLVIQDQRAWALAKLLLHASDHEKQLLKLLASAFPNTFQMDLERGHAFLKAYKRPQSVMKQNRLYEKASFDLRDLLHRVHEDPTNIDRQRAYLHQGAVCGMYAQDAYFSTGALADVVILATNGCSRVRADLQ